MEFDTWHICGILALCYGLGAAVVLTFIQLGCIELCLALILRRACRRLSAGSANHRKGALRVTHDRRGMLVVFFSNGSQCMDIDFATQLLCAASEGSLAAAGTFKAFVLFRYCPKSV